MIRGRGTAGCGYLIRREGWLVETFAPVNGQPGACYLDPCIHVTHHVQLPGCNFRQQHLRQTHASQTCKASQADRNQEHLEALAALSTAAACCLHSALLKLVVEIQPSCSRYTQSLLGIQLLTCIACHRCGSRRMQSKQKIQPPEQSVQTKHTCRCVCDEAVVTLSLLTTVNCMPFCFMIPCKWSKIRGLPCRPKVPRISPNCWAWRAVSMALRRTCLMPV